MYIILIGKGASSMKKNKKIFIVISIILLIIILMFFCLNKSKVQTIGNNSTSQEIVDYILNISSYEVTISVETKSNKNSNKYLLKQQYISPDVSTQEVLEPSNIQGTKIIKDGNNLKLENTNLNLSTVFENYEYLSDNALDLNCFIEDYKEEQNSGYEEKDNQIIMKTQSNNSNKYTINKTLYIDKDTGNPSKMEISDGNQNTTVYILYNEVKINSLDKQNLLAFQLYNEKQEV
jgi:outer membrane lipoprotein-sorting protein